MVKYENECVSCGIPPCLGDRCPNRNVLRAYCDKCGCETDELYNWNDKELCRDCLDEEMDLKFDNEDYCISPISEERLYVDDLWDEIEEECKIDLDNIA